MAKRREPGKWRSGILSVLVHLSFLGFLLLSVNWQLKDEAPQNVTLWDKIPVVKPVKTPKVNPVHPVQPPEPVKPAAVAPVVPPARMQQAAIALRQKRKKEALVRAEAIKQAKAKQQEKLQEEKAKEQALKQQQAKAKQKARALKLQKEAQAAAKAKQEKEARLKAEQKAFVRRQMLQEQASLKQARVQASAAANEEILNAYVRRIRDKIRQNEDLPPGLDPASSALIHVILLPTGDVISVTLVSSTGTSAYADAVERAIYKAQPLPLPPQPALIAAFKSLNLKFSLKEDVQQ
ncbi:MAG: cell envelope integrity protein TolA [Proteobacteria bacterium]|nr:cell envelope integrity protein TolA [Pseudomonadota bacterium]MDE3207583.1 cell envelope integrity protein TolA [Pseudomonadota bacterium]